MPKLINNIPQRIDGLIRVFIYILAFWLPYSPAVIESCVIIAVVLWIVKRLAVHWNLIKKDARHIFKAFAPPASSLNRPIAVFLIICILSIVSSAFWQSALGDFITKIMEWFAIYWLIQESFTSKRQIFVLLGVTFFTAISTAVDAILQFSILGKDLFYGYPVSPDGRATAGFKAPSGLGAYLASIIPLTLSLIFYSRNKMAKTGFLVVLGVMVWALMLTFTRGAWTGAFAGILVFVLIYLIGSKRIETAKTFLLALVFLIMTIAFPLMLNTEKTLKMIKRSNTIAWRLEIWQDSMRMIKDRPLFGHGVNTFMPVFQSYRRQIHNYPTYAHNCFIQLASDVGLLGLAAFGWIFLRLFLDVSCQIRTMALERERMIFLGLGVSASIAAYLVHSFFDTSLFSLQLGVYLWFLVGIQSKINFLVAERT